MNNIIRLKTRENIIEIPLNIAKKSPVLKKYISENWFSYPNMEPYYLNYSTNTVNMLIDYLCGNYSLVVLEIIQNIAEELSINVEANIINKKDESEKTICGDIKINDALCSHPYVIYSGNIIGENTRTYLDYNYPYLNNYIGYYQN